VKKRLTIGIVGAALVGTFAATLTFVAAGSYRREPVTEADALPAYEIIATVLSLGLNPIDDPLRRGPYYVLHATDRRGTELRVVADSQSGDILSVAPTLNRASLRYQRAPHIIHVPQTGNRDERTNDRANNQASVGNRDDPGLTNDDEDDGAAPLAQRRAAPTPRRVTPRWPLHSDAPPPVQRRSDAPLPSPSGSRRAVLSAPPLPAEGPTPIRPTPRFNSQADPADKFGQPRDARSSVPPPPPGYTPPSALPHED
jgi:hypothetical protein